MKFLKCFLYLFFMGILGLVIGRFLPYKWMKETQFPWHCFAWEKNGKLYEKLGIRHWHNKVPDMSKIFPQWISQKVLSGNLAEKLPVLIKETCIAEWIHICLGIAALYCLVIWEGMGGVIVTLLFEFGNLPYIMIQRYNRPRLLSVYQRHCAKEEKMRENMKTA